jgi:hypothetical protein
MSSPTNDRAGHSRATPPPTPPAYIDRRTPVLVGVGICLQRIDDAAAAREPMALMIDAALAAGSDTGAGALPRTVQRVSVGLPPRLRRVEPPRRGQRSAQHAPMRGCRARRRNGYQLVDGTALMAHMQAEEFCGRSVLVGPASFTLKEAR